jgi:hypothetical protein
MAVFDQAIERAQELRAVVNGLLLFAALAAAWFPGHNADRWGHLAAAVVRRAGWMWCIVGVCLYLGGLIEQAWPIMLMLWVLLAVWSYGKSATPRTTACRLGQGFEVLSRPAESINCDDIPTAAVAS